MCYIIYDSGSGDDPLLLFSGDTLFIGDVGRTDLPGLDIWETMSEKLFDSLQEKILPLGDKVLLYPSHTAGSICGSLISDREMSTIGYEKATNPQLKLDKEDFINNRLENRMLRPPYFRRMEDWNLNGPPLLGGQSRLEPLDIIKFEQKWKEKNSVVLDTRNPEAFAGSHIPDSINIWLDGVSFFPGWVLSYKDQILLLTERLENVGTARDYLRRIGFDNILGYLCPNIEIWRNQGKPIETLGTLSATKARKMLDHNEGLMLDVREEHEWKTGHIKEAKQIYIGNLQHKTDTLPRDKTIITTCGWGGRGGLAASILKRKGFEKVYNLLGGMKAWKSLEYPLEKE
jgi:hydroxyacylglutathione hydrolase